MRFSNVQRANGLVLLLETLGSVFIDSSGVRSSL